MASKDDLGGRIHAIVSGGSCAVGLESTILDISGKIPEILRPGAVTQEQIEEVLGMKIKERTRCRLIPPTAPDHKSARSTDYWQDGPLLHRSCAQRRRPEHWLKCCK